VLPILLKAYTDSTREAESQLLLRFASRLYTTFEPEPGPSRIGLSDLQIGGLDAGAPAAFTLRHRTFLPSPDSPAALRLTWPEESAAASAIVRYRDSALPPDVVFFAPGAVRAIPLAGVARVDWLVAGSAGPAPGSPVQVASKARASRTADS
jgi:hypothetical protein